VAPLFAALGDETRLGLVARLSEEGPLSIARLTEGSDVTRQAVSKHLRVMEEAGLLRVTRHGRETLWELYPNRLADARKALDRIGERWERALGRLKRFVEE
jgi:DNA-binding transcriptional ArsR family regulator